MIKKHKNILFSFAVFIVMLLSYSLYYNCNNSFFCVEVSAGSNAAEDNLSSNFDYSEDEQINTSSGFVYFSSCKIQKHPPEFPIDSTIPSFSFWQPPKFFGFS